MLVYSNWMGYSTRDSLMMPYLRMEWVEYLIRMGFGKDR